MKNDAHKSHLITVLTVCHSCSRRAPCVWRTSKWKTSWECCHANMLSTGSKSLCFYILTCLAPAWARQNNSDRVRSATQTMLIHSWLNLSIARGGGVVRAYPSMHLGRRHVGEAFQMFVRCLKLWFVRSCLEYEHFVIHQYKSEETKWKIGIQIISLLYVTYWAQCKHVKWNVDHRDRGKLRLVERENTRLPSASWLSWRQEKERNIIMIHEHKYGRRLDGRSRTAV